MSDVAIGDLLKENYSLEDINDIMCQVEHGKTLDDAIQVIKEKKDEDSGSERSISR